MSLRISNLVWKHRSATLKPIERLVLARMASLCDKEGGCIFPSYKRLAGDSGISKWHIMRVVKELVGKQYISLFHRCSSIEGKKSYLSNYYVINLNNLRNP